MVFVGVLELQSGVEEHCTFSKKKKKRGKREYDQSFKRQKRRAFEGMFD